MKTLTQLKQDLSDAKALEESMTQARIEIERQIVALMPSKLEGSVTQDGITVTYKVSRKADTAALQEHWNDLPTSVQSAFKWKADVSSTALRTLDEEAMGIAQNYFTTTPAKPSVTLKD